MRDMGEIKLKTETKVSSENSLRLLFSIESPVEFES
jgi:hypothetical protein